MSDNEPLQDLMYLITSHDMDKKFKDNPRNAKSLSEFCTMEGKPIERLVEETILSGGKEAKKEILGLIKNHKKGNSELCKLVESAVKEQSTNRVVKTMRSIFNNTSKSSVTKPTQSRPPKKKETKISSAPKI